MLQLNQVSLRRGDRLLFSNATFQVHAGQRLGVTGANGSGKSSLFQAILGSLEPDDGDITIETGCRISQVSQESPSTDRSAIDFVLDGDAELRKLEARLATAQQHNRFQDPAAWELMDTIDGYSAQSRAARLLQGLGFGQEEISRPVDTFSGGWRMRLNLAQALMCRSDLLLLDEPTNHLDLPAILWLEDWLIRYPGMLLLISHDRDLLDAVCNRIAHIEQQSVSLYTGNYSQFEKVRAERLAQQQALFRKQQLEIRHIEQYVERFRYKASKARQAQSRLKMLDRMTRIAPAHVDSPFHFTIPSPERQPNHLLRLDRVTAGYASGPAVLKDVNVQLSAGDRLGLLGVNGAGKSTVVKALADGSTVQSGERTIHKDTRIGYFTQYQLEQLHPDQTPLDHLRARQPEAREQDLRNFLGGFGFTGERIFDPVAPFSGGEKARLVLAMIVQSRPNLLLLDEPTNHLDLEMRLALSMALVDYDGALLVISHDRHLLRSVCDELLLVHGGAVEPFDRSLDEYAQWLAEQAKENTAPAQPDEKSTRPKLPGKKELRQAEAMKRARLKPLSDRVHALDQEMGSLRRELADLEHALTDDALYVDQNRKPELTALFRSRAEIQAQLEQKEWDWLEASEALENARVDPV